MNNFEHFEDRIFDLNLLNEMYAIPSKELSTNRITEILSVVTGQKLDNVMVSTIFNNAGLPLRERTRVTPKETENKPKRVTKADTLSTLFSQLGITPVVNGETNETTNDEPVDDGKTEQESQMADEAVETNQFKELRENPVAPNHFGRNTESIYTNQDGTDVVENNQFGTGSRLGFN
jgi:hypothetical protein